MPPSPLPGFVRIPALEVVGFASALNEVNRRTDGSDYDSNLSTIRRNLHSGWVTDSAPFRTNQLGHPYQGSMYFGFARSAGVGYWPSLAYSFGGSALWEIAGETTPPSRNDLINTGLGGSFLGEVLFRLSSLVLEHDNWPPLRREIGAAVISPPTGFNRFVFGDRFAYVFPEPRSRLLQPTAARLRAQHAESAWDVDGRLPAERCARRVCDRLRPAWEARPHVRPSLRLFHVPGDDVERERLREPADARAAPRHRLCRRRELPRHLGPLRELRLHRAADP